MTASARKRSLAPLWMLALMTASLTFGAMPTMPWPFASAAIDAGDVRAVAGVVVPRGRVLVRRAAHAGDAARGVDVAVEVRMWLASTPVSMTPTSTFGLPPVTACASGALMRWAYHCSGENVSLVDHRRVREPAAVPVPAPARGRGDDAPDGGNALDAAVPVERGGEAGSSDWAMTTSICGIGGDDASRPPSARRSFAAPDAPAVLGVQDDVALRGGRTSQRQRERSRERKHDETNGYSWPQAFLSLSNLYPMGAWTPSDRTIRALARLHSLGRGSAPCNEARRTAPTAGSCRSTLRPEASVQRVMYAVLPLRLVVQ